MDNKELKGIGGLLGLVALLESFGVRDKDGNTFKEFLKKNSAKAELAPGDVAVFAVGNDRDKPRFHAYDDSAYF